MRTHMRIMGGMNMSFLQRVYQDGLGSVRKNNRAKRWEMVLAYREVIGYEPDDEGKPRPVFGDYKQTTRLTDVPCYGCDNRGRKLALAQCERWATEMKSRPNAILKASIEDRPFSSIISVS